MVRVTRSTKITIAEDESNELTPHASHIGIKDALAPLQNTNNVIITEQVLSVEEAQIADEEKLLKAAFKTAIGVKKKNKKGKNARARNKQQHQTEEAEADVPHVNPAPEDVNENIAVATADDITTQSANHINEQLQAPQSSNMPVLSPPAQNGRLTRQQARNQYPLQLGQYNIFNNYGACGSYPSLGQYPPYGSQFQVPVPYFPSYGSVMTGSRHSLFNTIRATSSLYDYEQTCRDWLSQSYDPLQAHSADTQSNFSDADQKHQEEQVSVEEVQEIPNEVTLPEPVVSPRKTLQEIEEAEKNDAPADVMDQDSTNDDSFVDKIVSRSPAKPVQRKFSLEELMALRSPVKETTNGQAFESSIDVLNAMETDHAHNSRSGSVVHSPSRIEDSIDRLDDMEGVIEALNEIMPQDIASPVKPRKAPARSAMTANKAVPPTVKSKTIGAKEGKAISDAMAGSTPTVRRTGTGRPRIGANVSQPAQSLRRSASMKEIAAKAVKPAAKPRPQSFLPPNEPPKSSRPTTRPLFELPGEAIARRLKEQREARLAHRQSSADSSTPLLTVAKAVAPKVRSTKPPTKPIFELPGEAISRRKKEALEAKLKAQEEEERKKKEFRAKPMKKSVAAPPKETSGSLARKSIVGQSANEPSLTVKKRTSVFGRPSIAQLNASVNSSTTPRNAAIGSNHTRQPSAAGSNRVPSVSSQRSMSGLSAQRVVSGSDATALKQRAKEIYQRDARAIEESEKEKRLKEAAAKKAREEAAERGRQASREWAEKMRLKQLASKADKGLAPGYGPGGQLGLS
jgi:hypothetical protein